MITIKLDHIGTSVYVYDELTFVLYAPTPNYYRRGQHFKKLLSQSGYDVEFNHAHMVQALKNVNRNWEHGLRNFDISFKCKIMFLRKNKPTK